MYNKNDVLLKLNAENYYIDRRTLCAFVDLWKIDAVYEDTDGENFYDDFAIENLKKGINLKAQGYSDDQIIHKLNRDKTGDVEEKTQLTTTTATEPIATEQKSELKNLTLDVSTQTLQMLAEAVAKKITDDIINTNMAEKLIEAGGYKKDNEVLSTQIQELIEDNRKLALRIKDLEDKRGFFKKLVSLFK